MGIREMDGQILQALHNLKKQGRKPLYIIVTEGWLRTYFKMINDFHGRGVDVDGCMQEVTDGNFTINGAKVILQESVAWPEK